MKYLKSIPVILMSSLLLAACSSSENRAPLANSGEETNSETEAIHVKVITLSKSKISRTIDYTSTVLPYEEINMAPASPGRVEEIYVEEGDKIKKGDALFLMDRTQLYQLRLQLASLGKDLSRIDTLLKTGSAKQQQYDQLKTEYDVAKTNLDFIEENTLIKAPFDGIVTGKYFENSEMYSGSPASLTGKAAVVTVMQIVPLKVNVNISEQYYPLVNKGMNVSITADVYEDEVFNGKVSRVAPTVDPATRSFQVEVEFLNRNELLKPGMFVRVSMDLGEVETFVVPANTVLVQEGTNIRYVFIEEDGLAKRIEVVTGKRFDDQLEIISQNLKEGNRLVTEGQSKLINGDEVEIEM